ncbi:hypothetical protein RB595_009856 [Gaeumannomyces hyphopodioides]
MMSAQLQQAVATAPPAQAAEQDPARAGTATATATATATPPNPLAHNAPGQGASGLRSAAAAAAAASVPARPLLNRAGDSSSPYLRAHQDTPVAWQLLDDEAIARARRENKLIFLHIGFKACHYCRLTTQDSFCNPSVASLLNSAFVPVIVDREERPDIDSIYMNYVQALNSSGGWPLNMFLTPGLEPVFGGTYWPGPTRGDSAVGSYAESLDGEDEERLDFLAILKKLQKVWAEQETKCRTEAKDIVLQLREFAAEGTLGTRRSITLTNLPASTGSENSGIQDDVGTEPAPPPTLVESATATAAASDFDVDLDQLEEAYSHISRTFDRTNGGFNLAPKFPTPPKLTFLLRLARFPSAVADVLGGNHEVDNAVHMAVHTLRKLRDSGLRDHIGAGFSRYSATADWSMPHFEKMVADNALLLGVYLDAWLGIATASPGKALSFDDEFADVVLELADYLASDPIRTPEGLFATSEAADSFYRKGDRHMREGGYYLWTRREFDMTVREVGNTSVSGAVGGAGTSSGELAAHVAAARYNVLEHGNVPRDHDPHDEFISQNVLRIVKNEAALGSTFGISVDGVRRILASARERLRSRRERERVAPEIDDQVVLSVNALVVTSLARLGAVLIESRIDANRGARYLSVAETAIKEIKARMWDPEAGKLYRTSRAGVRGQTEALAEDYAFLIEALLYLYEATGRDDVLNWADDLQKKQIELFYDHTATDEQDLATAPPHLSSSGGFYATAESAPHVILRLKDGMDTSQPSANAVSASNLFRLALILGSTRGSRRQSVSAGVANPTIQSLTGYDYERLARETVRAFEVEMLQYPWLFSGLLTSVVTARLGGELVSVVGLDEETALQVKSQFFSKPRAALRAIVHAKQAAPSSTVPPSRAAASPGA